MIPLILSAIMGFYPTIDGQRQTLPYIEMEYPYVLGISVPPPDLTHITVTHNDLLYFSGDCQGTFDLGVIESGVVTMTDGDKSYTIVPEPVTITTLLFGTLLLRRKK